MALTFVSLDPLILCVHVCHSYLSLSVLNSNHAVVVPPLALTVPLSVAELVVIFVADPVDTVGTLMVLLVPYVTCNVSVPELFAPSFAVTVMTLSPVDKLMLETVQLAVPVAVPFPPLLLLHATLLMPLELSDALPPMLIVLLVAV